MVTCSVSMTKYAIIGHEKERSKVTNLLETMRKGRLQSLVLQNTRKVIEIDVGLFLSALFRYTSEVVLVW